MAVHEQLANAETEEAAALAPTSSEQDKKAWSFVCSQLKSEFGEATYQSWLAPVQFLGLLQQQVCLSVSTKFIRDWINTHYQERILSLFQQKNPDVQQVIVLVQTPVQSSVNKKQETSQEPNSSQGPSQSFSINTSGNFDINSMSVTLDPRFTFDNYVTGKSNELAYAAARRVAESDTVSFNPLFLYGGVGLGKTHLMHAIAWHIKSNHMHRKILYLSAEKFMYQFIKAIRQQDTMTFKEMFRSVDILMIDDVQFIAGKDSTQEEFFHTFNALVDRNRQVILSADKSPSDLEGIEERLKSRLGWGLVADIHPTTYELRLGILQSKAEQFGIMLDQKVMEYLAHKISSNVRELEGALNRLAAHASLVGRDINIEMTQDVLQDLIRSNDRQATIEEIQKSVATHFNIRISDLHSVRRSRSVALPRQVAMYLSKILTQKSLPEIGRKFGGRDHTTVLHAVRKIEAQIKKDVHLMDDIEILKRALKN